MKIGFFGGTFDPPHLGHLAVARAAADTLALDRVLLAPVASQPLRPHHAEAPYPDRLRMVELLCEGSDGLEASSIDGPLPGEQPNYTIDTLGRLCRILPEHTEIYVIVGEDAFRWIRKWRDPEELLRIAQWIVVSRPNASASWDDLALTAVQHARVHRLESVAEPASATAIRERLQRGEDCPEFLSSPVLAYIRSHHLYGT
jgi:nicotinate-nucleotide adenylyltransferase